MKIDEKIFNEMQDAHHLPDFYDLMLDLQARENGFDNYSNAIEQNADEDEILNTEIINVWYIPGNSTLMGLLLKYYHGMDSILKHVRSAIETDDQGIVFVTGAGYDIISSDLLDGPADGQAKIKFLKWINEEN